MNSLFLFELVLFLPFSSFCCFLPFLLLFPIKKKSWPFMGMADSGLILWIFIVCNYQNIFNRSRDLSRTYEKNSINWILCKFRGILKSCTYRPGHGGDIQRHTRHWDHFPWKVRCFTTFWKNSEMTKGVEERVRYIQLPVSLLLQHTF